VVKKSQHIIARNANYGIMIHERISIIAMIVGSVELEKDSGLIISIVQLAMFAWPLD
jgi:hypothetical protein